MHKRGQIEAQQILTLMEVLAGIAVVVFLILAATGYNSFTEFNRAFLKEDVKMLSNAVVASPGEVQVAYNLNDDYSIEIGDDVKVLDNPLAKGKHILVLEYSSLGLNIRRENEESAI